MPTVRSWPDPVVGLIHRPRPSSIGGSRPFSDIRRELLSDRSDRPNSNAGVNLLADASPTMTVVLY